MLHHPLLINLLNRSTKEAWFTDSYARGVHGTNTLTGLIVTLYIEMKPGGLTINLLDAQQVVHWQFKVVSVHVLVERSHDGRGVVGVFEAKRVAELVDRYQEQIVT